MARIWMPGGGGGADLDVVTASASNILTGKVIVDKDGNPLTGTMPDNTGTALTVATNGKTLIPKGYHDGTQYATNTQATMAGGTKTPTTSAQTIACNGKLMTSNIVIPAFSLPAASSIKKGVTVTIYGKSVTGTFEGYTTSPLYLYNGGTWSNLQSTGITDITVGLTVTESTSSGIVMSTANNYKNVMCRLNQTVNITDYKYLKVVGYAKYGNGTYGDKLIAGVSTSATISTYTSLVKYATTSSISSATLIIDVSSLSGSYYIYLGANQAATGYAGKEYVTAIYLSNS